MKLGIWGQNEIGNTCVQFYWIPFSSYWETSLPKNLNQWMWIFKVQLVDNLVKMQNRVMRLGIWGQSYETWYMGPELWDLVYGARVWNLVHVYMGPEYETWFMGPEYETWFMGPEYETWYMCIWSHSMRLGLWGHSSYLETSLPKNFNH